MQLYDRFLIRGYLHAAFKRAVQKKWLRPVLVAWCAAPEVESELVHVGAGLLIHQLRRSGLVDEDGDLRFRAKRNPPATHRKLREYVNWARDALSRSRTEAPVENRQAKTTRIAVRHFHLDATCGRVLELARLYRGDRCIGLSLWDLVRETANDHIEATAVLLGTSRNGAEQALCRLSEVGIADPEQWGTASADPNDYSAAWFEKVYAPPVATGQELRERLVPLAPAPLLDFEAFDHLDERDDALRLFRAAVDSRCGIRLLFYGRAGTGKTEFSKALALAAGARLYDLCEPESGDIWGDEATSLRTDRSAEKRNRLRMALALLRHEPAAAILIDEVEDVLSSDPGSRRENHRLLEDAGVPMIFTGNDLSQFDEALLRRFDLTIRFTAHSPTRRRSVVRRMLRNSGAEGLKEEDCDLLACRLADELECPPGIVERAIRSTQLVGGSVDDLYRFAERHERTISAHIARPRLGPPVKAELAWGAFSHLGRPAEDFRQLLTATLRDRRNGGGDSSGITFLAYGPPGCGKTEFCRTVAAEAGATL